ncbi:hypothetical protein CROQUDRAFT_653554 [Cronartium quercuum f. sp. fusiforme G11]|uniref:Uncharacterized protein n=1 Tax=Cronartium quercuum f. sp. fusiforme G11 TaxID=708437 RepID=A0A9P6NU21_9BASI|nr:hypothetical protein CROQUDRAFT_653554 [Cronartium quercuum f. sp. fusiforme G11]
MLLEKTIVEKLLKTETRKDLAKGPSSSYNEGDPLHKHDPCYQRSHSSYDYMAGSEGLGVQEDPATEC